MARDAVSAADCLLLAGKQFSPIACTALAAIGLVPCTMVALAAARPR